MSPAVVVDLEAHRARQQHAARQYALAAAVEPRRHARESKRQQWRDAGALLAGGLTAAGLLYGLRALLLAALAAVQP